jgi:hypothetical protein
LSALEESYSPFNKLDIYAYLIKNLVMSFEIQNMKRGTSLLPNKENTIGVCNEYFAIAKPPPPQKKKKTKKNKCEKQNYRYVAI